MVAKSYQGLETIGDVFTSSGKQYINVRLKSGKIKSVRFYSEAEYRKMYPEERKTAEPRLTDLEAKPQKEALGFSKGYITIFKGNMEENETWFHNSICRYARWWGWYVISTNEVPADLPVGIEPIKLDWEIVGTENGMLKPERLIIEGVNSLLYEASGSEYVGSVGERLELTLTVEKTKPVDGQYPGTLHLMRDCDGNLFIWITSAKSWAVGTEHRLRGTVKAQNPYKNEKCNILTRCLEVK